MSALRERLQRARRDARFLTAHLRSEDEQRRIYAEWCEETIRWCTRRVLDEGVDLRNPDVRFRFERRMGLVTQRLITAERAVELTCLREEAG